MAQTDIAQIRITNARVALHAIEQRLAELEGEHDAKPNGWGILGAIGYIENELIQLADDIDAHGFTILPE